MTTLLSFSLLLAFGACGKREQKSDSETSAKDGEGTDKQDSKSPVSNATATKAEIQWIENDFNKALALAKKEKKALLIDMWADWCHTCLAMKAGTLRDPGLSEVSDKFIWLAIDTEDPSSAEVMKRFPPAVWPTFFVVSPGKESVQATQRGSSSVREFRDFLERGDSGHRAEMAADGALGEESPLFHLRNADRSVLAGQWQEAATSYEQALRLGGRDWSYAAATQKNRISMLSRLEDKKACVTMASQTLPSLVKTRSSASTDFIYYASTCAEALAPEAVNDYRTSLLESLDEILAAEDAALSVDDRSDALGTSRGIAEKIGDNDRAMKYARTQQALLAQAVKAAETPKEEMTYIWHQVSLHVFLKEGETILPWVQSLVTRLPKEYDPPYRQAWLLLKLSKYEQAHASVALALPLVDGARKGRVLSLQAEIYKAQGKTNEERASREAVVAHYKSLAPGLAKASNLEGAEKALAAIPQ